VTQNVCANTTNDKNNCGACGKVCQIAPSCTSSSCNVTIGNSALLGEVCANDSTQFVAIPVTVSAPITVTSLGTQVIQYSSQYEIWLALYSNSGGKPGSLLASVKAVITGNGAKQLAVTPTNIAAGSYFIGATSSNYFKFGCSSSTGSYEWFDDGAATYYNSASAPSPAPATTTLTGTSNFWLVGKE
jgi:hypothetical protein